MGSGEFGECTYFCGPADLFPIAHVRTDLHYRHPRRQSRVLFSNVLHSFRFGIKMVNLGKLTLAQPFDIAYRRYDKAIQTFHGSGRISDVLALLQFEVVAVLIN